MDTAKPLMDDLSLFLELTNRAGNSDMDTSPTVIGCGIPGTNLLGFNNIIRWFYSFSKVLTALGLG
jgi:hypothetical protein